MKPLNTIEKKNNQFRAKAFSSLRFKKFKMDFDTTGIRILISARFLKKENYKINVQNGRLCLKIKQPKRTFSFNNKISQFKPDERYVDFDILLPDKQYQHINSALYQNNTLRIHLTKKRNVEKAIALFEAS
ncbi:hypothetical protein [Flavivirga sp. 57AJ16]|uniref:hypothetical protein n=1 Tax=Flavivirga sp. 57AJ16 TaxID=3025307 RepID=UPI002366805E|nr:hypothetical protein [Flavivirga sp. 57AJ16]MDD7886251.1 hypothetical protein [Flavivirga sp. 57AJ16]